MGSTSTSVAPGLQRKLQKVLENKTDTPELSKNLNALSEIYTENTSHARRNIRSIVENGILKSSERYLREAETMMDSIQRVHDDLSQLGELCDGISNVLREGQIKASGVIDEINRLEGSIELNKRRKEWLKVFMERYQLSAEETLVLKEGVIDDRFFEALHHVHSVHTNCRALGLSHHHKAGLDVMEELSVLQDEAFKNLCAWVQKECQSIDSSGHADIHELMPKAMKALQARPPLYSYCAEEIAIARRNAVFQKFIEALSHGTRPIEMHAADPWRYANDMLAWVHAAIASEMELLTLVFEGCYESAILRRNSSNMTPASVYANDHEDTLTSMDEVMDSIFEGICRPLKLRLEQILMSSPPPLLNFQLSRLIQFYLHTVDSVLGTQSKLSSTLRACQSAAEKSLKDQMQQRGDRLVRQPPLPTPDRSLPGAYIDRLNTAVEIMEFYETSLVQEDLRSEEQDEKQEEDTIKEILKDIIQPIIDSVHVGAEALNPASRVRLDDSGSQMDPSEQHVYIINCLCHIRRELVDHVCASSLVQALSDSINWQQKSLARSEVKKLIHGTHLTDVYQSLPGVSQEQSKEFERQVSIISNNDVSSPGHTAATPDDIADSLSSLFIKLSDPTIIPEFQKIHDHHARTETIESLLIMLVDLYTAAFHMASQSSRIVSLHPPEDIKTLLGITGEM